MAKTFTAPFAQTVNNSNVALKDAVAGGTLITGDSVPNIVLLFTAGTEGSLVTSITAIPRGNVSATLIYLFLSSDNGTSSRLIDSILIPTQTLSTTIAITPFSFTNYTEDYPLRLKANERIYAALSVSNNIVVSARGMDY